MKTKHSEIGQLAAEVSSQMEQACAVALVLNDQLQALYEENTLDVNALRLSEVLSGLLINRTAMNALLKAA